MIPSPEVIRQKQAEQRRLIAILSTGFAAAITAGWLIDHAFTALNAARIAGGW
jgi:hypothetical protein